MNIIITGATGFIGSHLLEELLREKTNTIHIISRPTSNFWRIEKILPDITVHMVENLSQIEKIFAKNKIDLILHLATTYHKQTTDWQQIAEMNYTNITFPAVLLDIASKYHVKGFINTGTCFEYQVVNEPTSEATPIQPYNYYATTKISFEQILKFYTTREKLKAMTLKLFFPYGEKDNKKLVQLIIASLQQKTPLALTHGTQQLDYIYVSDIVQAYLNAIKFIMSQKYQSYEVCNIGTGATTSVREIVKHLEIISHSNGDFTFDKPFPENEILYMQCNPAKAEKLLHWKSTTNIFSGLKKTYAYYQNHTS